MAGAQRKDLLGRLADLSEDAIQRLAEAPGADRALGALNGLKERVDELQKRLRGLEELEKRLAALERKVDRMGKGTSSTSRSTARRSTTKKS
ncbi:MAG TPA: hypothetical protein VHD91_08655 [Gaiellaceae bacterium]|nr:hypothetical protein [Gaiellaceae bacterium]